MQHHVVLRVVAKILIPFILLFALYVQFHGDYGPGGGFQAGVLFAAGIILYAIIFGLDTSRKVVPMAVARWGIALGLLLYALTGVAGLLLGGNYLNYSVLGATQQSGQHIGILVIEFGVGLTVASVMLTVFYAFAGKGR